MASCVDLDGAQLDATRVLLHMFENDANLTSNPRVQRFLHEWKPAFESLRDTQRIYQRTDFDSIKVIGRGKDSDISLVRQRASGEVFALKTMGKAEILLKIDTYDALLERDVLVAAREAGLESLSRIEAAFQDDDHLYILMRYEAGGDLFRFLELAPDATNTVTDTGTTRKGYDAPLSVAGTTFYLAQLAQSIHDLHQLGYVHRDIKPENVFINSNGNAVLGDFGSAGNIGTCRSMSASVGTSEYLSPEVLMDAGSMCAGKVNQSDDWWSFGALAYEMLSGQLPFSDGDGDDDATIFFNILNFTAFAFPKDTPLSEDAKTFITSLLSSVESRASFDSIKRHAFFAQVDWSKLWDSKPEFVPDLSGPDDSKYFGVDEGCQLGRRPKLANFPLVAMKAPYAHGLTQLPFVGWSYHGSTSDTATATGASQARTELLVPQALQEAMHAMKQLDMSPPKPRRNTAPASTDRTTPARTTPATAATSIATPAIPATPTPTTYKAPRTPKAAKAGNADDLATITEAKPETPAKPAAFVSLALSAPNSPALPHKNRRNTMPTKATHAPAATTGTTLPPWKLKLLEIKREKRSRDGEAKRQAQTESLISSSVPEWKKALLEKRRSSTKFNWSKTKGANPIYSIAQQYSKATSG